MPLSFHITHEASFPYPGNNNHIALEVVEVDLDPALIYLNQTYNSDPIAYMTLDLAASIGQQELDAQMQVVSGFAYNPFSKRVLTSSHTDTPVQGIEYKQVRVMDPETGQMVGIIDTSQGHSIQYPAGIATNGFFMVVLGANTAELRAMQGTLLGTRTYPGRSLHGATTGGGSWVFLDQTAHEILLADPFGAIRHELPAPGPAGGAKAIAFDRVTNFAADQTIWSPQPWLLKHRLYVANASNDTLYAGYVTGTP